jgi:hypothetical protein
MPTWCSERHGWSRDPARLVGTALDAGEARSERGCLGLDEIVVPGVTARKCRKYSRVCEGIMTGGRTSRRLGRSARLLRGVVVRSCSATRSRGRRELEARLDLHWTSRLARRRRIVHLRLGLTREGESPAIRLALQKNAGRRACVDRGGADLVARGTTLPRGARATDRRTPSGLAGGGGPFSAGARAPRFRWPRRCGAGWSGRSRRGVRPPWPGFRSRATAPRR